MSQIDSVYKQNAPAWHRKFFLRGICYGELHHIFFGSKCKVDISKCCMRLFYRANPNHHDDFVLMNLLRKERKEDYKKAKLNYVDGKGCKEEIFEECRYCKMPKLNVDKKKQI